MLESEYCVFLFMLWFSWFLVWWLIFNRLLEVLVRCWILFNCCCCFLIRESLFLHVAHGLGKCYILLPTGPRHPPWQKWGTGLLQRDGVEVQFSLNLTDTEVWHQLTLSGSLSLAPHWALQLPGSKGKWADPYHLIATGWVWKLSPDCTLIALRKVVQECWPAQLCTTSSSLTTVCAGAAPTWVSLPSRMEERWRDD